MKRRRTFLSSLPLLVALAVVPAETVAQNSPMTVGGGGGASSAEPADSPIIVGGGGGAPVAADSCGFRPCS